MNVFFVFIFVTFYWSICFWFAINFLYLICSELFCLSVNLWMFLYGVLDLGLFMFCFYFMIIYSLFLCCEFDLFWFGIVMYYFRFLLFCLYFVLFCFVFCICCNECLIMFWWGVLYVGCTLDCFVLFICFVLCWLWFVLIFCLCFCFYIVCSFLEIVNEIVRCLRFISFRDCLVF